MRHVKHHGVCAPSLDERAQLILKVLGLLPCKSGHGKGAAKTLPRQPMAGFAVLQLGLKILL
jgi:hypothetical protein